MQQRQNIQDYANIHWALTHCELFAELSPSELMPLVQGFQTCFVNQGEVLMQADQPVTRFLIISQGVAEVLVQGELVAQRNPGDFLGEMGALLNQNATATVVAGSPMRLFAIERAAFQTLVPKFTLLKLLEFTGQRQKAVGQRLAESLQHSPQGLIKLDQKGHITTEVSQKALEYLQCSSLQEVVGLNFAQLMDQRSPGFALSWLAFEQVMSEEFQGAALEMMLGLLPRQVTITQQEKLRHLGLTYYPCCNLDGSINGLDVGLEDITARHMLHEAESQRIRMQKVYADPDGFFHLMDLIRTVLEPIGVLLTLPTVIDTPELDQLKRDLHTLKGVSGQFDFLELQKACHQMEDMIVLKQQEGSLAAADFTAQGEALFHEAKSLFLLADQMHPELKKRLQGLVISLSEFAKLKWAIREKQNDLAIGVLDRLMDRPLSDLIQGFSKEAAKIASALGKEVNLQLDGNDILIPKSIFEHLSSTIHLIRNAVDHGLEAPDEREQNGKSPVGSIIVQGRRNRNEVRLLFWDDGRGLDRERIFALAADKGLLEKPLEQYEEKEIFSFLFLPGFTTRSEVTEISGRGIGMNALWEQVTSLGGNIEIESTPGQFTCFSIKIPL